MQGVWEKAILSYSGSFLAETLLWVCAETTALDLLISESGNVGHSGTETTWFRKWEKWSYVSNIRRLTLLTSVFVSSVTRLMHWLLFVEITIFRDTVKCTWNPTRVMMGPATLWRARYRWKELASRWGTGQTLNILGISLTYLLMNIFVNRREKQ